MSTSSHTRESDPSGAAVQADPGREAANRADRTPYVPTEIPNTPLFRWVLPNVATVASLIMLAVSIAADMTIWAWATATALWLFNRFATIGVTKAIIGLPQTMAVGAAGFGMMLRIWTIAFVIFFISAELDMGSLTIGLGRNDIGVPAIGFFLVLFTIDTLVRAMTELRRYKVGVSDSAEDAYDHASSSQVTQEDAAE